MDSYGIFMQIHTFGPKISILDPKSFKFDRKSGPPDPPLLKIPDFPETIPACWKFAEFSDLCLYPEKLSYSSRNAYIKKTILWSRGELSYTNSRSTALSGLLVNSWAAGTIHSPMRASPDRYPHT